MNKSIAAENSATLNGQNLVKWLKNKNECFALISDLFSERAVRLNYLIFEGVRSGEGALLPVPIIDDALIIRQLLHFRIKMTSLLCF